MQHKIIYYSIIMWLSLPLTGCFMAGNRAQASGEKYNMYAMEDVGKEDAIMLALTL